MLCGAISTFRVGVCIRDVFVIAYFGYLSFSNMMPFTYSTERRESPFVFIHLHNPSYITCKGFNNTNFKTLIKYPFKCTFKTNVRKIAQYFIIISQRLHLPIFW